MHSIVTNDSGRVNAKLILPVTIEANNKKVKLATAVIKKSM
jgi:hypothetical protein